MAEDKSNIKQETSNKIEIGLSPWMKYGYTSNKIHLVESLGGEIAKGEMELTFPKIDESLELITKERTGELFIKDKKSDGVSYTIPIFIYERDYFKNILRIKFFCIKDYKFFTDRISVEYKDITEAITKLYPGNVDIRTESDINNNITIYQNDETNYSLCKRLAYSYKKNSIFSFGFEGFMLKDLEGINSIGKDEKSYEMIFNGSLNGANSDLYNLKYEKTKNTKPFNPWEDNENSATKQKDYADLQPKNCRAIIDYTNYTILSRDYYQMADNSLTNRRILNTNYSDFKITHSDIPIYKIGDVLTYITPEQVYPYPFKKFLVLSNEVYISQNGSGEIGPHGLKFEWTTKLKGLDAGDWTKEIENDGLL